MLVCQKNESITMLVQGAATPMDAKYDGDRAAMDLANGESRNDP